MLKLLENHVKTQLTEGYFHVFNLGYINSLFRHFSLVKTSRPKIISMINEINEIN